MQELLEDFSRWTTGALTSVPPESLEFVDLTALVIELQKRLEWFTSKGNYPNWGD